MSENAVGRRQALRGAGIAAGGVAIAGLATATPAMAGNDNGLFGSWMCVRQDDGTTDKVRLVLSFAAGDVVIEHDISPAGPPFTGSWERRGDHRFRATFWSGFPGDEGPGSSGPTIRIRLTGRVARDNISGTFTFTVFAPTGEQLESADGTFTGTRIDA